MSAAQDPSEANELPAPEDWPAHWPSFETFLAYFAGELLGEEEDRLRAFLASDARARTFARELAAGIGAGAIELAPRAAPSTPAGHPARTFEGRSVASARPEAAAPRELRAPSTAPATYGETAAEPRRSRLRLLRSPRFLAAAAALLLGGAALLFAALRTRPTHGVREAFLLATQISVIGDLGATRRGPGEPRREALVARAGTELVLSAAVPDDAYVWFVSIERESARVETFGEVALRVAEQRVALARYRVPEPAADRTRWLLAMVATTPLGRAEEARVAEQVRSARDAAACAEALRRSFGCVVELRPLEILPAEAEPKVGAAPSRRALRAEIAAIEKALRQDRAEEAQRAAEALLASVGAPSDAEDAALAAEARWEIHAALRLRRAAAALRDAAPSARARAAAAEEARLALAREFPLLAARGALTHSELERRRAVCREAADALAAVFGDQVSLRWAPLQLEAQLLQLAGDAAGALACLEEARRGLEAAGAARHPRYASLLNDLSGASRALGESERARQFAAGALRLYEEAEIGGRVLFEVLRSLADLHRAAGEAELALEHARAAEEVLAASEDEGGRETALLHLHLTRASLAEKAGNSAEAERELAAGEALARRSGDERRLDTALARRAELLRRRGEHAAAAELLRELRARDVARYGEAHAFVALDDLALGRCCAHLGRDEEALERIERAFTHFEQRLADAADLRARLDVGAHAEIELLAAAWSEVLLARGEVARAFDVRERARARSLLELHSPAELDAGARAQLAELRARKSALHAEIQALAHAVETDGALASELAARQHALADLLQEEWLAERAAARALRAALPAAAPMRAEELGTALAAEEALWLFAWSEERVDLLWSPPRQATEAPELFAAPLAEGGREVAELRAEVARAAAALRDPLAPCAELLAMLRALAPRLIPREVLARCATARAIALVLDGPLAELPLAALIVDGEQGAPRFLLEIAPPLSHLRSLAALRELRRSAPASAHGAPAALLIGAPSLLGEDRAAIEAQAFARSASGVAAEETEHGDAPRLAPLPETAVEVRLVAAILTARGVATELLLGAEATPSRTAARAAGKRLVHLASHGRRGESWRPEAAAIALAPEAEAPTEPGRLDLVSILRGWPRGDASNALVVLSACESGVGAGSPARELALPAAFHRVGVPSVIASLWPIDSAGTVPLVAAFYEELAARDLRDAARALHAAQRRLRAAAEDPRAWAAFAHFGVPSER